MKEELIENKQVKLNRIYYKRIRYKRNENLLKVLPRLLKY